MTQPGRPPSASEMTLSQIMDQHHTNLMGTVHVGRVLNLIGDVVHVHARITWAGRSSIEVAVKVAADLWDRAVPPTTVVISHLVMVAIDDDGKQRPVPLLVPETDEDHRALRQAEIRRRHRSALRDALANDVAA